MRGQIEIDVQPGREDGPETGSNERTLFMFVRERTTSSLIGTLPPTSPVFPPWGTTPMRLS